MKHYCSRVGCHKQREEEEMLSCNERGRMGFTTKYFCKDTNCYGQHLAAKNIRSTFRKNVHARNFKRY